MKKNFSARLRELRGETSQVSMARKIGISQPAYSSWEAGTKIPLADGVARVSITCGISADWLLGLSDNRDGSVQFIPDPALVEKCKSLESEIERLKEENSRLNGMIAGLKLAFEAIGSERNR